MRICTPLIRLECTYTRVHVHNYVPICVLIVSRYSCTIAYARVNVNLDSLLSGPAGFVLECVTT